MRRPETDRELSSTDLRAATFTIRYRRLEPSAHWAAFGVNKSLDVATTRWRIIGAAEQAETTKTCPKTFDRRRSFEVSHEARIASQSQKSRLGPQKDKRASHELTQADALMSVEISSLHVAHSLAGEFRRKRMFGLSGQRALVVGIANEDSIAYGCAKALSAQGVSLAVTYLNENAERYVRPLANELGAEIIAPLDVTKPTQIDALFHQIHEDWGGLDTLVHSIAYCPKNDLHGRVTDCSREGFQMAMDISVGSFIHLVRKAEPLMPAGGTCLTVSFYGAEKVVENYNVMGPVKAALEMVTRYMAAELAAKGISVHALSPGPLKTRAASGIDHFDELLLRTAERTPTHHLATIEDVGAYAVFLASKEAANVTGGVHHIDGGYHIVG